MIRKITVQLTIIHLLFSSDATYNNKQMVNMMYKYFSSSKNIFLAERKLSYHQSSQSKKAINFPLHF